MESTSSKKISRRKYWNTIRTTHLIEEINKGKSLSEIKMSFPGKSDDSIMRQGRREGYSSSKMNGDIYFTKGIKRRNRKKKTEGSEEPSSLFKSFYNKIVSKLNTTLKKEIS